jgi:CPA2 family monovalent cation:H+ antiporter-2
LLLSVGSGLALAGVGARFFGVPLALAAFVGGLAVGESPAAAEARRRILPFRDLFAVLFFVLLGSLIDPRELPGALPWIALLLGALVIGKGLPTLLLALVSRLPGVQAWRLAVGLAQVGEFSFVLGSISLDHGLIRTELYSALLVAVVISIVLSTTLVRLGAPPSEERVTSGQE